MNYPVPHFTNTSLKPIRNQNLEGNVYVDHQTVGPPIYADDYQKYITANNNCTNKCDQDVFKSATLPAPLFLPTPVSCGRGKNIIINSVLSNMCASKGIIGRRTNTVYVLNMYSFIRRIYSTEH